MEIKRDRSSANIERHRISCCLFWSDMWIQLGSSKHTSGSIRNVLDDVPLLFILGFYIRSQPLLQKNQVNIKEYLCFQKGSCMLLWLQFP